MAVSRFPWKGHPRLSSGREKALHPPAWLSAQPGDGPPARPIACASATYRRLSTFEQSPCPPACWPRTGAGRGEPSCPYICSGGAASAYLLYRSANMNSRWEAVCSCGSQGKVGNGLAQANPHQNQQTVRGFGMFVGKTEIGNLSVRICFLTGMSKNSKTPQRAVVLK